MKIEIIIKILVGFILAVILGFVFLYFYIRKINKDKYLR